MPSLTAPMAASRPNEIAVVDGHGSRTWAELDTRVAQLIGALRSRGLDTGATVVLLAGNRIETVEVILACMHAGYLVVPVNNRWVAPEIAYVLEDTSADAIIVDDAHLDVARDAADAAGHTGLRTAFGDSEVDGYERFSDLLTEAADGVVKPEVFGGPMFYTSGTTGQPKGVRSRLNAIGGPAEVWRNIGKGIGSAIGVTGPGSTFLLTGPIYHSVQWVFSFGCLLNGSSVVLQPRFEAAAVLADIDRHMVTHTHLVPTQMLRLLRLDAQTRDAFSGASLQQVFHGAAPCPTWVKRGMIDWWGPRVTEYYGGTEAGFLTTISSEEWIERPGSVGRPGPDTVLTIVDGAGEPQPSGEAGSIRFRNLGGKDFAYHNAQEKTERAHPEPGVGTLGDIGWVDDEGYLHLTDRAIDMIVSGGVNIYPAEIESSLSEHPAVADVAVVGLPDEEMGEVVVAVVETEGTRPLDRELINSLEAHCRQQIAAYKVPKRWEELAVLPRNEAGKVPKHDLRSMLNERRPHSQVAQEA